MLLEKIKMKKFCILLILLLMFSQFSLIALSDPEKGILYVDDDNTSGPWEGSLNYPYQHIQDALNVSSDGDTVFVFNGTYTELVTIDKEVALIGEDNSATILQDIIQDAIITPKLLTITADNVAVENLCIRQHNNTNIPHFLKGIYCSGSDGTLIRHNRIVDCTRSIEFRDSSGEILDNHISYFGNELLTIGTVAVKFYSPTQGSELTISNNTIINYEWGIFFDCHTSGPSQILIDYNHMESSGDEQELSVTSAGIRLYHEANQNYYMGISHNLITGFRYGVYYKDIWDGVPILEDTSVDILSNSFDNIENDLLLTSGPLRSDEKLVISKNNFFGQNNKILFLKGIILGPTLPLTDMIFKSSFEWSQNYWAGHSANGPVLIPGRLVLMLFTTAPGYGLKLPIFQTDEQPASNPHEI